MEKYDACFVCGFIFLGHCGFLLARRQLCRVGGESRQLARWRQAVNPNGMANCFCDVLYPRSVEMTHAEAKKKGGSKMSVRIVWTTPDADQVVGYCARVSNPANQDNEDVTGLLRYCARHGHWSVFEMASACIEVNTTRDIARQMLRHRSLSFQEFSQRYADASLLGDMIERECRIQDTKNRQNSLPCEDSRKSEWWSIAQKSIWISAMKNYKRALKAGIAKEQARALLPEGLTPSRLYASGTLRSWIHFINVRSDASTQKEHRQIATAVREALLGVAPIIIGATT